MRPLLLVGLCLLIFPVVYAWLAPPGVYMETWPDGSSKVRAVSERTADGDYIFDGPYVSHYQNGHVEREGEMRQGKEQGPWIWWYESGEKRAEGNFHGGSGSYVSYYPSGQAQWQGQFDEGHRAGVWTEFSEQGRKLREGPYERDRQHGEWTYWHEDDPDRTLVMRWHEGVLLEDGQAPPSRSIREPEDITPWQHAGQILLWLLVLVGPVPLALAFSRAAAADAGHGVLVLVVTWIAIQIAAALVLGSLHLLRAPVLYALEAGLLALGVWRCPTFWRLSCPWTGTSGSARVTMFSGLVLGLSLAWWLASTPTDNFDSLAYHLPTLVGWFQDGSLLRPTELGQVSFYPFHWEILGVLQVFPFAEDLAVALPNLLAWLLLGLSTFVLARGMGADIDGASIAAVAVCAVPAVLVRAGATQPDLAVAALFLGTIHLGRVARRDPRGPRVLAWALGLTVLLGLKGSAIAYAVLSVAFVLLESPPRKALGVRWPWIFASVALVLVLGGYWYLRNWWETGNPLGFVEVKLAGVTVWPGSVDATELRRGTMWTLFEPSNSGHWRLLGSMIRQELALPFLILAGGALGLLRPTARRNFSGRSILLWVGLVLAAVALYWNTPYGADNGDEGWRFTPRIASGLRFGFPALAALGVAAAMGLSNWPRGHAPLAVLAVASVALGMVGPVQPTLWMGGLVVAVALLVFWRPRRRVWWAPVAIVFLVTTWMARDQRDEWRSTLYGDAFETVQRATSRGSVVGYALTQTRFPYYGRQLDRRLVSVVPRDDDFAAWLADLRRARVEVLVLGTTDTGEGSTALETRVRDWVSAPDAPFEQLLAYQSRRRDITVVRVTP